MGRWIALRESIQRERLDEDTVASSGAARR